MLLGSWTEKQRVLHVAVGVLRVGIGGPPWAQPLLKQMNNQGHHHGCHQDQPYKHHTHRDYPEELFHGTDHRCFQIMVGGLLEMGTALIIWYNGIVKVGLPVAIRTGVKLFNGNSYYSLVVKWWKLSFIRHKMMKMMKAYIVRGTCVEVAAKHHKVSIGVFHPPHQLLHLVIRWL